MTDNTSPSPGRTMGGSPTLWVIFAAFGFATVPFFAEGILDSGISPAAIAFYRYALPALVFLPYMQWNEGARPMTFLGLAAGAVMGIGWIGYVHAIETLPISTAEVIYMTYPAITLLIGWLAFQERPDYRAVIGAAMIFAAAYVAMAPEPIGMQDVPTLVFAFMGPFGLALSINVLTRILIRLPVLSRISCVSFGAALGVAPVLFAEGLNSAIPASVSGWGVIVVVALFTAILPQILYSMYAPVIGAARTAMASSIDLPMLLLIGWIIHDQVLSLTLLFATALIIAAIIITKSRTAPINKREQSASYDDLRS